MYHLPSLEISTGFGADSATLSKGDQNLGHLHYFDLD